MQMLQNHTTTYFWSKLNITVVGPAQKGTIKSSQILRLCYAHVYKSHNNIFDPS